MSNTLGGVIAATADTFRREPPSAQRTFVSASRLGDGFRSDVRIRDHALTVDEPHGIGGSDAGPTPVELVLAALAQGEDDRLQHRIQVQVREAAHGQPQLQPGPEGVRVPHVELEEVVHADHADAVFVGELHASVHRFIRDGLTELVVAVPDFRRGDERGG